MLERQNAVEAIVGRQIACLRELTPAEATKVLEAFSVKRDRTSSSWDGREEDTWIDRL